MDAVILTLKGLNSLPDTIHALDLFGMYGLWNTKDFAPLCTSLEMWEIQPCTARWADRLIAQAKVSVGDSIAYVTSPKAANRKFNFIVSDNPVAGVYGPGYCEHFEIIPAVFTRLKLPGVLVLNVVTNTLNIISRQGMTAEEVAEWMQRRSRFYTVQDSTTLRPNFLTNFYSSRAASSGLRVDSCFFIPRNESVGFLALVCSGTDLPAN
jgi:hypothetical protein